MAFSEGHTISTPARFSIAGGFAVAVMLVSLVHVPPDVATTTGPLGVYGVDKWIHAGSYGGITVLLAYASRTGRVAVLVGIALATVLLGAGVELIQSTIPWRSMELADIAANAVGAFAALAVSLVVTRRG